MATRSISKNVDSIPPMVKERNSGAAFFIHLDDATKETGDQTKSNTSSLQQAFENYRNAKLVICCSSIFIRFHLVHLVHIYLSCLFVS